SPSRRSPGAARCRSRAAAGRAGCASAGGSSTSRCGVRCRGLAPREAGEEVAEREVAPVVDAGLVVVEQSVLLVSLPERPARRPLVAPVHLAVGSRDDGGQSETLDLPHDAPRPALELIRVDLRPDAAAVERAHQLPPEQKA